MKTEILTDDRIIKITSRIQKVYFVFICIGTLDAIYNLSGISESSLRGESLQGTINLFLYIVIYIGLRLRKKWLISLVLISSAWLLLSTFLATFQSAVDVPGLLAKAVCIMLVLFYAYQMHFFSRREVKSYFGMKGTIIF